jgi:bifunctional oligoribonuclease and PAP phosphatase NrnA
VTRPDPDELHYGALALEIRDVIERSKRVLAVSHANPDADAICSLLTFETAFSGLNRQITLAIGPGTVPASLGFLPDLSRVRVLTELGPWDYDLVAFLDCADRERAEGANGGSDGIVAPDVPVLNIDHHITNQMFGTTNLVDPEAAATCEMLALLLADLSIEVTPELATVLMAGIQGDTLGLRTPSTTSRTLRVASDLLAVGADLHTIVDNMFRLRQFSTLKLWGLAVSRARFVDGLVWTEITPRMLEESGASPSEGEGIVNFLAGTIGARVAALLYQEPEGWRVSLRSLDEDVDVADLAALYGGGGHSRASGLRLRGGSSERDSFLADITRRIGPRPAAGINAE